MLLRENHEAGCTRILLETIVLPGNQPDFGKILDLEMLLMPGGRERTGQEFRRRFARADVPQMRISPTQSPLSVIEAR
jgi:hypothetical protein